MASVTAVDTVLKSIKNFIKKDVISIIDDAIFTANDTLFQKSYNNEECKGMGTTLVIATAINNTLFVANVGDSRLYLIDSEIRQITRDHSFVEEMVSIGEIDKSEARTHEKKNIITRAIGVEQKTTADYFEVQYSEGAKILMCSDGLTNMVDDKEIFSIVSETKDLKNTVIRLIDRANDNGGKDNIAVLIVEL